eukprot:CAMPEP_0201487400 /NCGR_PEP_ID=MMETSP0151_2-20130828/12828_1 /ASSEMBLY_ACC=CAM_ASM_000257 /TAXON_ID=200890 /ORGANISM="Paramoeba atlantica, Strain 621/1 / CCAP 1560/9" /LENGTH=421 /DNA_ID=CAMNT_0047872417 /DNA_START=27 /DNA_END=1292 /DNA_ORIENTATION=+
MAALEGSTDLDKLHNLCKKTHKEQAVWFLNAFWEDFAEAEAEKFWDFVQMCHKIDNAKEAGIELDEMEAHRFLEKADEAHTVLEMRSRLRKTGAIGASERPKVVPLSHYLLFKYDNKSAKLFQELVNRSQGDNRKAIEEAQSKLDAVSVAFDEASRTAAAASAALKEAQSQEAAAKQREGEAIKAEADAKKSEAEAHQSSENAAKREASAKASAAELAVREEEVRKSQEELAAALAEVQKQEEAYNSKTQLLKKKSEEGGVVSRNKAKNELAQHLAEDPLPLRQAKITAEAALRKAEKATQAAATAKDAANKDAAEASAAAAQAAADAEKASAARRDAEGARAQAEAARAQAEAARADAESKKAAADAAVDAAQAAVQEAEEFLAELKAHPGNCAGALWWMDRELHEKKKYMPMRKGGIAK